MRCSGFKGKRHINKAEGSFPLNTQKDSVSHIPEDTVPLQTKFHSAELMEIIKTWR